MGTFDLDNLKVLETPSVSNVVVDINDWKNSREMIELVGAASVVDGSTLRLTPAKNGQVGAVWFKQKQNVAKGFEFIFNFKITQSGADGFAFVIQNDNEKAIGEDGCQMGV